MLPSQVVRILNFFDACGFNSGTSDLSKNIEATYLVYAIHVSLAVVLTLFEFRLMTEYYPLLGLTEAISESLQYSAALYTYWLIILDSLLHRRAHQHFWEVLQQIDVNFSCQPKSVWASYTLKFCVYFMKTLSIMVIRLFISSFVDFTVDFAYISLFIVCEIRMFYYLFCLEVLHFQMKTVEDEVKIMMRILNLANIRRNQSLSIEVISACYSFEIQRLKWIRGYFHCVYNMIYDLNIIFGWSHVAGISFCFYYILTESNWFYIHFREISYTHRIVVFLTILHWQLLIFYLFHSATNCSLKMRNIFYLLNTINCSFPHFELGTQVETTMYHMIQHSILLHAKGIFLIDNGTFLKLTSAITAYMIMFLQFSELTGFDKVE